MGECPGRLVPASLVCGAGCLQQLAGKSSCLATGDRGPRKLQRKHLCRGWPSRRAAPLDGKRGPGPSWPEAPVTQSDSLSLQPALLLHRKDIVRSSVADILVERATLNERK